MVDDIKVLSGETRVFKVVNLSSVTIATEGSSLDVRKYKKMTVFVNVSVNSGAVTMKVEVSPDGATWYQRFKKTYTAVTGKDLFNMEYVYPFIRTTTTTQSNSTVTTTICGRS